MISTPGQITHRKKAGVLDRVKRRWFFGPYNQGWVLNNLVRCTANSKEEILMVHDLWTLEYPCGYYGHPRFMRAVSRTIKNNPDIDIHFMHKIYEFDFSYRFRSLNVTKEAFSLYTLPNFHYHKYLRGVPRFTRCHVMVFDEKHVIMEDEHRDLTSSDFLEKHDEEDLIQIKNKSRGALFLGDIDFAQNLKDSFFKKVEGCLELKLTENGFVER